MSSAVKPVNVTRLHFFKTCALKFYRLATMTTYNSASKFSKAFMALKYEIICILRKTGENQANIGVSTSNKI